MRKFLFLYLPRYTSLHAIFVIIILFLITSCASQKQDAQLPLTDNPEANPDPGLKVVTTEEDTSSGVMPNNPNGLRWYEWQSGYVHWIAGMAMFTNRNLMGCDFPMDYDELLSSGLLPVIFHNRYTGEPIKSTEEYAPGDIFYGVDLSTSTLTFSIHRGPLDEVFDPESTGGEWLPYRGSLRDSVTDGKTVKMEMVLDPTAFNNSVPASEFREYFRFPLDDDARVRISIVYQFINDLMYQLGGFVDQVPGSLDDYIAMVGEKNPVAWINPYTGEPMRQVEWFSVPLYYGVTNDPVYDPMPDITPDPTAPPPPEDIAGNYAYKVGSSPIADTEFRPYAQFYFKQPDGSIAAYLAIGVGPKNKHAGALKLDF